MPRYTQGFPDATYAQIKHDEHGALLGADTVEEYVEMADRFLGAPLAELENVQECQRPTGELMRYNLDTEEIGFMDEDRFLLTYYKSERTRRNGMSFREYCYRQCHYRWAG